MAGKSILNRIFDKLRYSFEVNANCDLTPRQCRALLEREEQLQNICDTYVQEIKRLNRLLELERSDE